MVRLWVCASERCRKRVLIYVMRGVVARDKSEFDVCVCVCVCVGVASQETRHAVSLSQTTAHRPFTSTAAQRTTQPV